VRCCASRALTLSALALCGCGCGGQGTTPTTAPRRAGLLAHTATTSATDRPSIVAAAERAITADARSRVRHHEFEGPVRRTSCKQRPGPAEGHSDVVVYSCIAIKFLGPRTSTAPPLAIGQLFQVRIDFPARRFTWCKYEPPGGEGTGRRGTEQPPPEACGGIGPSEG
jgi:hypothetical protein